MNFVDDSSPLQGVTVLAVDDDSDSRELLMMTLEMYGATVVACGSVKEALAVFAQVQPQAIISDIAMPNEDGYDLMKAIRSLPSEQGGQIPAIALSAMVKQEDQSQAFCSGFNRFVKKPMDFEKLIAMLVELLEERNGNQVASQEEKV